MLYQASFMLTFFSFHARQHVVLSAY